MPQKKWYIYIIQAENGHLYTGITTDIDRRFQEHKSGNKGAKFFKSSKAKEIVHLELALNRSLASKREAAIKKLTRAEKLSLIDTKLNKLNIIKK